MEECNENPEDRIQYLTRRREALKKEFNELVIAQDFHKAADIKAEQTIVSEELAQLKEAEREKRYAELTVAPVDKESGLLVALVKKIAQLEARVLRLEQGT